MSPPMSPTLRSSSNPGTITHMAILASFEGCSSLVARWQKEGPALLLDRAERARPPKPIFVDTMLSDEPEKMRMPTVAAETDISLFDPDGHKWENNPSIIADMGLLASERLFNLSNLGNSLLRRFEQLGDLNDLARSVSMFEEGVALLPEGHSERSSNLNNLGNALLHRFERLRDIADINRSVEILREATDLCLPLNFNREWISKGLGTALLRRYERLGDWSDILEARPVLKEALQRLPADHPARPSTLKVLGDVLLRRFEHLGELTDIQEALSLLNEAVNLSPGIDPNNDLGYCLVCRFQRLGDLRDIRDALVICESSAGCSEISPFHQALRATIPTVFDFLHDHDVAARSMAVEVLATIAAYPSFREALGAAMPTLISSLKYENDPDLTFKTAVSLDKFPKYPLLGRLFVDHIPLIDAELGRNSQDKERNGEPQPHGDDSDLPTDNAATTSVRRSDQSSGRRRRGAQSKEEDPCYHTPHVSVSSSPHVDISEAIGYHTKKITSRPLCRGSYSSPLKDFFSPLQISSVPSPPAAHFTIPEGVRNYLKGLRSPPAFQRAFATR
ncbi:hypothetical protein MVEN_01877000 [Mycena venus]|uniref:Uncharacterized protein n=1 Tax=Mycena venus TaxID=2733690 RepID=A0A8H6XHY8_9AGAR|nr:hypothetical protein MVEN_01877000 [Mycena venus]